VSVLRATHGDELFRELLRWQRDRLTTPTVVQLQTQVRLQWLQELCSAAEMPKTRDTRSHFCALHCRRRRCSRNLANNFPRVVVGLSQTSGLVISLVSTGLSCTT